MDYHRIYKQLINKAAERTISGYKEKHHVIPKCMGGNNDKDNIVDLTAREHFVAHMLLCKIYPDNKSLAYALWAFVHWGRTSGDVKRFYKISSRQYSVIRELYSKVNKGGWDNPKRKKRIHTIESKRKISESKKGSNNPNAKPVTVYGISYATRKECLENLGINKRTLYKILGEA